jgi:hypothetical protein
VHGVQGQSKKIFSPGDVGHRLAALAALERVLPCGLLYGRQAVAVVGQQPGAVMQWSAHAVQQQHLCVDSGHAQCMGPAQALGQGEGGGVH